MDQADNLRNLVRLKKSYEPEFHSDIRVIAITSGKGGVGKTNLTLNMAIHLANAGKRVIVIDADFGMANIEVLMGINPIFSFKDVLAGTVTLADALTRGPAGVRFLSGGSGLTQLADLTESQLMVLISGFEQLDALADIVLIDTGAGMSKSVTNLLKASHETIVVTTSDPTSIADAYAVIKALTESNGEPPRIKAIINRVDDAKEGIDVFSRLQRVCNRFLSIGLSHLGSVPYDRYLMLAVKAQEPLALLYPHAESNHCIEVIAKRLLDEPIPDTSGVKRFIDRWVSYIRK